MVDHGGKFITVINAAMAAFARFAVNADGHPGFFRKAFQTLDELLSVHAIIIALKGAFVNIKNALKGAKINHKMVAA